jgi:hypothetical protein
MSETDVVCLITQRSQVQILPPLLFSQVRGPLRIRGGSSALCVLTRLLTVVICRLLAGCDGNLPRPEFL